jgi:hypothetical protein
VKAGRIPEGKTEVFKPNEAQLSFSKIIEPLYRLGEMGTKNNNSSLLICAANMIM